MYASLISSRKILLHNFLHKIIFEAIKAISNIIHLSTNRERFND